MSKSTKRTVIIAVSLLFVAIALFGFVAYQVIAKGHLLTEQVVALETQRIQEASYFRLIRQAEETTEKRAELKQYFLQKESDSIDFLTLVESVAPKAGVVLETDKLDVLEEKNSKYAWIQTSFSFSGTRKDVQNFVQILESLPYVQRLTKLEMTGQSSELWQASVTMQVRVLSYDK